MSIVFATVPPYPSYEIKKLDTWECIINHECPICGQIVSYSGGYFICHNCCVQIPNFPL